MTENSVADAIFSNLALIDTVLNVSVFVFIGIVIWLYTAAPVHLDD